MDTEQSPWLARHAFDIWLFFASISFVATGTNYPTTEPALALIALAIGGTAQWHYMKKDESVV